MKPFQKPRGTRDFLPEEMRTRRKVEKILRDVVELYGFEEVYTPTFELFELMSKKAGDDIRNTMYVFRDKGDRELALRAEGTPSVTRVYIDEFRTRAKPVKFYYFYPMFRYDRPQFGRFRELFQIGIELYGSDSIKSDVEILSCVIEAYKKLGFRNFLVKIGDRGPYREVLQNYTENEQNELLALIDKARESETIEEYETKEKYSDVISRITSLTTLRGADALTKIHSIVPEYDPKRVQTILETLKKLDLDQYIEIDFSIVRGLEYYTSLVFEVFVPELTIAIGAGGRYDNLVETYGGTKSPAIGFGFGFDRIMIALEKLNSPLINDTSPIDLYVASVSDNIPLESIVHFFRSNGIKTEYDLTNRALKKQLSIASAKKIPYVVIVGEDEIKAQKYTLKDMNTGSEVKLERTQIASKLNSLKK